jgi:ABC-type multidrug transport system fused ATPase/permease subunit
MIKDSPGARAVPDSADHGVSVEFDRVRFSYPTADKVSLASLEEVATLDTRGGDEVLHDVTFSVAPGRMLALVGSSGAGKSTVAQLLARLYDVDSGTVRLAGEDVRDLTAESIHRTIGFVTQDGHLLHDTIAANLRIGAPEATDADLWQALERARLGELVAALPDGLGTVVGERGYRLSGGERQRMTIARILLSQPRVVVLDEATASLDSTSEAAVQAALAEALTDRTAIVIAHRLSTIREADEILVLESGRVAERGTHTDLLNRDGRYAELHQTQFATADAPVPNVA